MFQRHGADEGVAHTVALRLGCPLSDGVGQRNGAIDPRAELLSSVVKRLLDNSDSFGKARKLDNRIFIRHTPVPHCVRRGAVGSSGWTMPLPGAGLPYRSNVAVTSLRYNDIQ